MSLSTSTHEWAFDASDKLWKKSKKKVGKKVGKKGREKKSGKKSRKKSRKKLYKGEKNVGKDTLSREKIREKT